MWAWGRTGGTRSEARGILYPRQGQMGFPKGGWLLLGGVVFLGALFAQRPFREYPWRRVQQLPDSKRLAGENRVGLRPPDVPAHAWSTRARRARRLRPVPRLRLDAGALQLDHRLSAVGPPFLGGAAALDARACAVGGAAGQSGRRRPVRLAVALRGGSGPLEPDRCAGQGHARVSAAWRLLHV